MYAWNLQTIVINGSALAIWEYSRLDCDYFLLQQDNHERDLVENLCGGILLSLATDQLPSGLCQPCLSTRAPPAASQSTLIMCQYCFHCFQQRQLQEKRKETDLTVCLLIFSSAVIRGRFQQELLSERSWTFLCCSQSCCMLAENWMLLDLHGREHHCPKYTLQCQRGQRKLMQHKSSTRRTDRKRPN